jgi:YD repeat-containing protein
VCESLGLNPDAQPFAYLRLNGKEILYATRGATDQLAAIHRITREIIDGPKVMDLAGTKVVMCAAKATHPNGRTETSIATLPFSDPTNVLMKAETKAKRRVTMSILGLALLDEMELETIPAAVQEPGGGVDLAAIGIERSIGTRPTLPAPALPAPARWAVELTECVSLHDVRGLYATHSRYASEDAPARNRAMVDDVRAWLGERGVPGVTGAEASAILSTLPEAALRALSELWCDEERPVSDRCVTAARTIHRAEWDEHSRRTAHTVVVRCYAHATGHTALNAAGAALVASRDADATPAQLETPADDVPADVLAKIVAKGSAREILNSVGAHAAEVLTSPALAKAYAARLCTFDVAGDPRTDAQRMEDELGRVMKKAREKAAAQG